MSSDQLKAEPNDAYTRPAARVIVEIALVCAVVAVLTAGTALWLLTSALAPSHADVSTMVSQRLDGPGLLRHELAREDGPVVQTLTDSIEANQQAYIESRRSAVARACGLTALIGAVLAALAGWFGASRAQRVAARVRPDRGYAAPSGRTGGP